jgi:hypothetical protein
LKAKNNYWSQRYTERWVKFGDECTKLFHAAATNRYMPNTFLLLTNDEGIFLSGHDEKAESAFIPFVSFGDLDDNTFKRLTSLLSVEQEI